MPAWKYWLAEFAVIFFADLFAAAVVFWLWEKRSESRRERRLAAQTVKGLEIVGMQLQIWVKRLTNQYENNPHFADWYLLHDWNAPLFGLDRMLFDAGHWHFEQSPKIRPAALGLYNALNDWEIIRNTAADGNTTRKQIEKIAAHARTLYEVSLNVGNEMADVGKNKPWYCCLLSRL